MKIDSGLNGYQYRNRTPDTGRKTEDVAQVETAAAQRFDDALTGSQTFLSASLANTLWTLEVSGTSSRDEALIPALLQDRIKGVYQEFA